MIEVAAQQELLGPQRLIFATAAHLTVTQ